MAGIEFIEFVEFVEFVELAEFMESRDGLMVRWLMVSWLGRD